MDEIPELEPDRRFLDEEWMEPTPEGALYAAAMAIYEAKASLRQAAELLQRTNA